MSFALPPAGWEWVGEWEGKLALET